MHPANGSPNVPDWLWTTLDSPRPETTRLGDALEAMSQDKLVAFARHYRDAAEAVCNYWDGPVIDGEGLSEDGTEDLCNWIVSQGQAMWRQAIAAGPTRLEPFVRKYEAQGPAHYSPFGIACAVYERRFNGNLFEAMDGEERA